jgi:hypothetical protein
LHHRSRLRRTNLIFFSRSTFASQHLAEMTFPRTTPGRQGSWRPNSSILLAKSRSSKRDPIRSTQDSIRLGRRASVLPGSTGSMHEASRNSASFWTAMRTAEGGSEGLATKPSTNRSPRPDVIFSNDARLHCRRLLRLKWLQPVRPRTAWPNAGLPPRRRRALRNRTT